VSLRIRTPRSGREGTSRSGRCGRAARGAGRRPSVSEDRAERQTSHHRRVLVRLGTAVPISRSPTGLAPTIRARAMPIKRSGPLRNAIATQCCATNSWKRCRSSVPAFRDPLRSGLVRLLHSLGSRVNARTNRWARFPPGDQVREVS
jgi:hypothetical protein